MYAYGYFNSFKPSLGGVSVDPDAKAFITAASITDPTQQSAVNQLVLDLKAASIWTKMKAVYPFVGSAATPHRYNLVTATADITWNGGITHSSNGVAFGGSNGYGATGIVPNIDLTLNSSHISLYVRTNTAENSYDMGSAVDPERYITLSPRRGDDTFRTLINDGFVSSTSNTDSKGFYIGNRTDSNVLNGWKNGIKVINTSNASGVRNNRALYIGALNYDGLPLAYSSKQVAFASIGTGLSDTDASNLYTAVQTFQTTLGRNV